MDEHGARGYSAGCRCRRCKDGWAAYVRQYRYRRGQQRPRIDREIAYGDAIVQALQAADHDRFLTVTLTPLAWQILVELQRRTRVRRAEILDQLLRNAGTALLRDTAHAVA